MCFQRIQKYISIFVTGQLLLTEPACEAVENVGDAVYDVASGCCWHASVTGHQLLDDGLMHLRRLLRRILTYSSAIL